MLIDDDLPSAELGILGAVIATGGSVLDDLAIRGDDFENHKHGTLFDLMRNMHDQGRHVDAVTLANANPDHAAFLFSLTDYAPFVYAVPEYAEIIATRGMHRRLQGVADALRGIDPRAPVSKQLEAALNLVDGAAGTAKVDVRFVRDILPDVFGRLEAAATFVPTPWRDLNTVIGGLRPGALYVVAARPGVGKTVLAAQLATKLAEAGVVAFSSLEMSEDELVSRLLAERLNIRVGKLKDNRLTPLDWDILAQRRHELEGLNIAIDDRAAVSPTDIRAHAKAVSRQGKLAGVVVDYMQLMASTTKQDRHVQVADFSRQLKIMAKDFKVPVIALSQLNRESESRVDKRPRLADLRESGAIEQDADVVILLMRQESEYGQEKLVLDIAKNRHGITGGVELEWQGEFSRAADLR